MVVLIRLFPIYRYPNPSGKYRVGYKGFTIPELTSIGIYYPTTERTTDIQYSPCPNSNQRLADVMKFFSDMDGQKALPKSIYKLSLDFLRHQYLGVNKDAQIIKAETADGKFPVIVFSHGLSANIHIYSILLKEWASHGFVVFSVDHEEEIDLEFSKLKSHEHHMKLRNAQLEVRKKTVAKILDIVCDQAYVQEIFKTQDVSLNYEKLFLSGHSFGGGTTAELMVNEKRITGGLVLLDPWFECNDENVLYQPINKPLLVLKSEEFETNTNNRRRVKMHTEMNSKTGLCLAGHFKNSMHNDMTDTIVFMPREMVIFGMLGSVQEVESLIIRQAAITYSFLSAALKYKEGETGFKAEVLDKYRERISEFNVKDTLLVAE